MKMALIGGGGVRTVFFTQSLSKYSQKLGIDHLVIMDIDEKKMEIYGRLAQYAAIQSGDTLKIELTTDFIQAVTNADYVVTTMRVGQDEARIQDERVALKYGVIGQETTGAGGFAYALRTIPAMLQYCKIIEEKSNNALIFNFTNPSGLVTQAMHSNGYKNVVGICDNATGVQICLAEVLQINASDLFVGSYGLNHLSWVNSVKVKGVEILDRLLANEYFVENFKEFAYFDKDLIRMIKEIPNGYLYYYYHRERALKNIMASKKTRGESIKDINDRMLECLNEIDVKKNPEKALEAYYSFIREREESYMSIELGKKKIEKKALDVKELVLEDVDLSREGREVYEGYAGVAFNYIEAVKNNRPVDIVLNVGNNGAISGLKNDDVVEISCFIDRNGAAPVKVEGIPENNMLLINQVKRYERLTVEAIQNHSKELAVQALMVHPLVNSYSLAKELVGEYLKVHKRYLGEWK